MPEIVANSLQHGDCCFVGHLGLFRAAILQSGSALVSWALQDSPLQEARNAAVDCNCTAVKTSDMVDCLKNADLQEIFNSEAVRPHFPICVQFEVYYSYRCSRNHERAPI